MFRLHWQDGYLCLEDVPIHKHSSPVEECMIEGVIGKLRYNQVDLLICIAEAEHRAYCSRISSVAVIPLNANLTCQWHRFKKVNKPERRSSLFDVLQHPTVQSSVTNATKLFRDTSRLVNDLTFDDVIETICDIYASGTFYYSNEMDLFDGHSAFVFNHHILNALEDLSRFGVRIMQGFVQQEQVMIENHQCAFLLVSRRSRYRNGLRYQKRGVDALGFVANFVETKQVLSISVNEHMHTFEYLQIRGSIPLFWSQENGVKPLPILKQVPNGENQAAMTLHMNHLKKKYNKCTCINLAEMDGKEGILGMAFLELYHSLPDPIVDQLICWDFHAHCPGTNYGQVAMLIEQLNPILNDYGYTWKQDDTAWQTQKGIMRVNCMDCLDRTNVIQTQIGWYIMKQQLIKLGVQVDETHPIYKVYKHLYADNGDQISKCYAGTNALKNDFTRYGQRQLSGYAKDATSSVQRLYLNFVRDKHTQVVLDLMLGE